MRVYQCHKRVKAERITDVVRFDDAPRGVKHLVLADGAIAEPSPGMFARYTPEVGDYLVEYEDGYRSISPRKAFEDGYALVEGA